MKVKSKMSAQNSPATNYNGFEQSQTICSSVLEVSDGKGKPCPRRLVLTSTHLHIQRNIGGKDSGSAASNLGDNDADSNRPTHGSVSDRGLSGDGSFDSFGDPPESPPPEFIKREVTLHRVDGTVGLSVRGGAEHDLPLIISRLTPGSPAALCKQVYIGDAIIAINGHRITRLDHDRAVEYLNHSGPTVTLKLKYYPSTKPYLSPTQQNLVESNLNQWDGPGHGPNSNSNDPNNSDVGEMWETERSIPLLFALLTRYLGGTDRLRCNAFEVRDATGNSSSGIIHCGDAYNLTSWTKCIADAILGLNNVQIKLWCQETGVEVFYVGWVWEGNNNHGEKDNDENDADTSQPWLSWKPRVLAFRGPDLYYMNYPPGVGSDWDERNEGSNEPLNSESSNSLEAHRCYPIVSTLLRVLAAGEHLDERQHCFTLQIATERDCWNNKQHQPITFYLNTETRQELIKVETSWTRAVAGAVRLIKKCSYAVWWGGKPCQLELDFSSAAFNLYRSSSKPQPPIWTRPFSSLKGSSDDSRTKLTLKFHGETPPETMECRDLHRVLFTIHSFLLAKVIH